MRRDSKMFGLTYKTPASWLDKVLPHTDTLLLDQAHLEKKAASIAMGLMFRFPASAEQHQRLAAVVREELEHFEQVMQLMRRRGIRYEKQAAAPYAEQLHQVVRDRDPGRSLDRLLCCAVIEARSCERLKLLGEALCGRDDELSTFYLDLVRSEAQHFDLYVKLAESRFPHPEVHDRMGEILDHEGRVLAEAPDIPRLHS